MHSSAISMRAFTKGRAAFDSDEEYRLALRGELDEVCEDFGYEANEDPDDGEAGDGGEAGKIVKASEAVKAELERFEDSLGTKFVETLERFMRDASGKGEPSYLPFPPVQDKEVLATFCSGSEGLRLRYGAYGLAADRLEGLEVVETWRNLVGDAVLGEWDEMFSEEFDDLAEEAEESAKDKFFDNGENPSDDEAVRAELERFEERIGRTRFLEVLERFMQKCSGCGEPPYLPFIRPVRDVEHLACFRCGSEAIRLRYGAYGLEADRIEGDEIVKTWKDLDGVDVLNDWDDAFAELAEEAELEKEDLEDRRKDEFFDDTLPAILADRKRGAEFLDFAMGAAEGRLAKKPAPAPPVVVEEMPDGRIWFGWNGDKEFFLRRANVEDRLATWYTGEFLDDLRVVAWDDPDARDFLLGGELKKTWDALDDAWYDEDEDDLVANSVGKFLAGVEDAKKDLRVVVVQRNVAVCDELVTGRVEMRMVWARTYPDAAELTYSRGGKEETFGEVPLAFLRWWRFCRERRW